MDVVVEGHCSGISSGWHDISLSVEACNASSTSLMFDGFDSSIFEPTYQRLIIEEFFLGTNKIAGSSSRLRLMFNSYVQNHHRIKVLTYKMCGNNKISNTV